MRSASPAASRARSSGGASASRSRPPPSWSSCSTTRSRRRPAAPGDIPAKRTFQALRTAVNGELDSLASAVPAALAALREGGRIVVMAYQSLEDRIVKGEFASATASRTPPGLPIELPGHEPYFVSLTRGAEKAGDAEIDLNPRSASVRLRALEKVAHARSGMTSSEGKVRDGQATRTGARQRRAPARATRRPGRQRRSADAPPRGRRSTREQRPQRSAPHTSPMPRPIEGPVRPKNAAQAKARAKARKAKAPKVIRPPLRERMLVRLAAIDLDPRRFVTRVPFVVLVIGALGLGLGVTLWLSTDAAERSYQLGHAREVNQALLQQKEGLERDVLEAQAAPALAEAARNLGMIPSTNTAHLVQDASGNWMVVGTPKPAAGVQPPPLEQPAARPAAPAPPAPPPAPRVVDPREVAVHLPPAGVRRQPRSRAARGRGTSAAPWTRSRSAPVRGARGGSHRSGRPVPGMPHRRARCPLPSPLRHSMRRRAASGSAAGAQRCNRPGAGRRPPRPAARRRRHEPRPRTARRPQAAKARAGTPHPANARRTRKPRPADDGTRSASFVFRHRVGNGVILLVLLLAAGQLFMLQVPRAEGLRAEAAGQLKVTDVEKAVRGSIVDRNDDKLAFTTEARALTFQPVKIQKQLIDAQAKSPKAPEPAKRLREIAKGVAGLLNNRPDADTLYKKLIGKDSFVYLARAVDPTIADAIITKYPEVGAERQDIRQYPGGSLAANIVGGIDWDGHGLLGLEDSLDSKLSGTDGSLTYDRGSDGVVIPGSYRNRRQDVRMLQHAHQVRFREEHLAGDARTLLIAAGVHVVDLDGDVAAVIGIVGQVDDTGTAAAHFAHHHVLADLVGHACAGLGGRDCS